MTTNIFRNHSIRSAALIVTLTMVFTTVAQTSTLSQAEALSRIIDSNPTLKLMRLNASADSLYAMDDASGFGETEIEFERLWGPADDNRWSAGISQSFDWPGAYGARRKAAAAHADAFHAGVAAERQNLIYEIQQRFADAVYATKRLELARTISQNIDSLASHVLEGYRHGELTILDVKKSRLEQYNARNAMADAEQDLAEALMAVEALSSESVGRIDFSEYQAQELLSLDEYRQINSTNNLTTSAALAKAEASQADAKAESLSRLPSFKLGYVHAFEDDTHFNGLTVAIGFDLFRGRKNVAAAQLASEAARTEYDYSVDISNRQTDALYAQVVKRSAQLAELSSVTLDPDYLNLLMMALRGGEINVISYLEEINYYNEARSTLLATDFRLRQSLLSLNRYLPK